VPGQEKTVEPRGRRNAPRCAAARTQVLPAFRINELGCGSRSEGMRFISLVHFDSAPHAHARNAGIATDLSPCPDRGRSWFAKLLF